MKTALRFSGQYNIKSSDLKKFRKNTKALVSRSTHYHPYTEMAVDSRLLYLLYSVYEKTTEYGRPISFFNISQMFLPTEDIK